MKLPADHRELLQAVLDETRRVEGLPPEWEVSPGAPRAEVRFAKRDLASGLGVSVRNIRWGDGTASTRVRRSRLFTALEKAGLVIRASDTIGGTSTTHVALTDAGRKALEA